MSDLIVHEEVRNLRSVRLTIDPNSKLFVVLLAVIVMLPSLSIDSCLASLPDIGRSLRAQPAASALILSLFMVGFAVGQMTFGPLCDRFGRRPALLIGCGVFALAAIGCAAAPSIQVLVAWRFLQGIGAAAGPVISLAIIRDAFAGSAARKRFAYVGVVATLAPIVAPTLGSFVSSSAGWRAVFCFLAVGGILLILVVAASLGETIVLRDHQSLSIGRLAVNCWRVISNRSCRTNIIVGGLSFGALFAYVSGAALVFIDIFGLNQQAFGGLFALNALGLAVGGVAASRLSSVQPSRIISSGLAIGLGAIGALVLLTAGHAISPLLAMPCLMVNTFSIGMVTPNIVHGVMQPVPEIAGVASSLFGSARMLAGAISAEIVAVWYNGTPTAMTGTMLMFAAGAFCYWLLFVPSVSVPEEAGAPKNLFADS